MSGYNRVIIMGNLTRVPDFKQLPSGQAVCKLGIATSRVIRSKSGESQTQEVCFIDIDVWGPQAEVCKKYLEKGSSILVEGRLRLESWSDQTGSKRSKHTIVSDRVTFVKTGATLNNNSSDDIFNKGEIDLDGEDAFKDELPF